MTTICSLCGSNTERFERERLDSLERELADCYAELELFRASLQNFREHRRDHQALEQAS